MNMEAGRPFTLGLMILVMVATASGSMDSLCPPAFIDMESFFAKSLQQSEQMRTMFDNFKLVNSRPDNCRYSEGILGNIDLFNAGRCQRDDDVEVICTTTTTSTTTTTTTTTTPEPTPAPTPSTVKTSPHVNSPEWSTSLTSSTSSKNPIMTSAPPRPVPQPSSPEDEWTTHSGDRDSTTKGKLEPGEPGKITPGDKDKGENSVADKVSGSNPNENHTIYYVVGGAVALIIVVLISLIVVCRNQSSAAGDRKKRLLRQRSDLQRINSIPDDTSRTGSSVTDPGSWRYSRSGQRGKKWRPHYSSENSSEVGSMKSTKMLLREESRQSTSSTEFRFNTLKQLEHPNAIVLGGFGETSTDYTLSRNGTLPNGNGTLPNGNGTLPHGNGTLPNGNHNTTVEMNGEAETKFDYDQPKLCINGYDNPAMSKCSSFDSVDRAIDDWKNSLNANGMPEEELVNSQNEMMFSYENKAAEFDIPTEPAESVANDTAVEVPKDAPVSVTIDTAFTTPIESSKPPISNSTSNLTEAAVIKPAEESNVVSEISSPNNAAPVAVVHPTKRLSVKDRISMFEGEKTNTLQAKSANGVVANGYNNNKFHSLPRKLEKPSAHVQPQQVIIQDRDADVML